MREKVCEKVNERTEILLTKRLLFQKSDFIKNHIYILVGHDQRCFSAPNIQADSSNFKSTFNSKRVAGPISAA